jgi:murein DD-endopeptidase MepM/ murein hydrolase activator NlpD
MREPIRGNPREGYQHGQTTFYRAKHRGVDYLVAEGTPIYATQDEYTVARNTPELGKNIEGVGQYTTRYGHLSGIVKTGKVREGELIAYSGNTGLSTSPHLHFDVRKTNSSIWNFENFLDPKKLFISNKPTNMEITRETFISNARIFNRGNFETNLTLWNHINIDHYWGLFQKNPEKYEQILDSLYHNIADIKKKQGVKYMDNNMNWIEAQNSSCVEEVAKARADVREATIKELRERLKNLVDKF